MKYDGYDIKVVWIDLDDTLIDFKANSRQALRRVFAEQGLSAYFGTPERWIDCYEVYNHALWAKYNVGYVTRDYLKMERFRMPLMEYGVPESQARAMSAAMDTMYLDYLAQEKQLVPGAMDLLHALRATGVTIGVLSNGFKEVQHRKIRTAGLDPYIDIVVLSDDIGINKPDTRLYRHAMAISGQPTPEAHMMIGDNPDTDIAGAIAAGWHAVLLDRTGSVRQGAQYQTVSSLATITDKIMP
ncbi:MAG: YjjG family noncanonical pyrimidine nucleotidase [Muribaculaceae bacterium]|nr:YjjG family noncanonical pyrimidine nucleotidase [Muribaculaceae bacterium]